MLLRLYGLPSESSDPWLYAAQWKGQPSGDYCTAARRKPQRMGMDAVIIAIPTLTKPSVTTLSCHGCALRPAAVIGDIAAVPKIAASMVTAQLLYVPYSALQEEGSIHDPFQMCGETHARIVEFCSTRPVSRPIRNRNIPCQSNTTPGVFRVLAPVQSALSLQFRGAFRFPLSCLRLPWRPVTRSSDLPSRVRVGSRRAVGDPADRCSGRPCRNGHP